MDLGAGAESKTLVGAGYSLVANFMNLIIKLLLGILIWYGSLFSASHPKESSTVNEEERYKNAFRKHQAEMMLEEFKKLTTPEEIRAWALEQINNSGKQLTLLDRKKLPKYIRQFRSYEPLFCTAHGDNNPPYVNITWGGGQLLYGIEIGDKDYRTDHIKQKAEWVPGIYLFYLAISG